MTNREKLLTGAVVAAGVMWFGSRGLTQYRTALDRNTIQEREAAEALGDAKFAQARGERARRQLNEWTEQSLPANREIAESLYEDWLREQLTGAGLEVTQLSDRSATGRNPQFTELSMEYRGAGTLAQLADFLYRFYTAPHLHRISAAALTPTDGGKKLTISLTFNALILPDTKRADKLAAGEPRKLPGTLDEFKKRLNDRNLFVAYTPKGDKQAAEAKKDEIAGKTKISMTTTDKEEWIFSVMTEGSPDVKYFKQGDDIDYGKVKGKVIEIDSRGAVIQTEKGRVGIRIGQKFSEAVPIESPAAQIPGGPSPASSQKSPAEPA